MSTTILKNIIQTRAGGKVERCHSIPHHGSYCNASHQWNVAMLVLYLFPEAFPRVVVYALTHDVPEFIFGDVPAPTMRYVPGLRDTLGKLEAEYAHSLSLPSEDLLSEEDLRKVKACDALEFWLWCKEQLLLGNRYAEEALQEVERFFEEKPLPNAAGAFFRLARNQPDEDWLVPKQAGVVKAAGATVR